MDNMEFSQAGSRGISSKKIKSIEGEGSDHRVHSPESFRIVTVFPYLFLPGRKFSATALGLIWTRTKWRKRTVKAPMIMKTGQT